jgi:hypothetical protein
VGTGDEDVTQVVPRVAFDVVHLPQAVECFGIERLILDGLEVDVTDVGLDGVSSERCAIEGHARCSARDTLRDEWTPFDGRLLFGCSWGVGDRREVVRGDT